MRWGCVAGTAWIFAGALLARGEDGTALEARLIEFDTTEATDASIDASRDAIVFTLLGDLYRMPQAGGQAEPISAGSAWDRGPRISPDGTQVAFLSDRDGHGVYIVRLADGAVRPLCLEADAPERLSWIEGGAALLVRQANGAYRRIDAASGATSPAAVPWTPGGEGTVAAATLSPDGAWVAYVRLLPAGDRIEVCRMGSTDAVRVLDAGTLRAHANAAEVPDLCWTPDGKALLVEGAGKIRRVPVDGSEPTTIPFSAHVRFDRIEGPRPHPSVPAKRGTWTPRGVTALSLQPPSTKLAAYTAAGNLFVGAFRVPRGQPVSLHPAWDDHPFWSPDGRDLAFQRFDGRRWTTTIKPVANPDEANESVSLQFDERVVHDGGQDWRLHGWHPDGERLLVSRRNGPSVEIAVLEPVTGLTTVLHTESSPFDPAPFFGEMDSTLYWTSGRKGGIPNLWKLPPAQTGEEPIQVTRFESGAWESRLSSDGERVLFRRNLDLCAAPTDVPGGPADKDVQVLADNLIGPFGWFKNPRNTWHAGGGEFWAVRLDDLAELTFPIQNIFALPPQGLSLVVEHVSVVDLEQAQVLPDRTILVADGRVTSVVEAWKTHDLPRAPRVDGTGLFAIPGFFETDARIDEVALPPLLAAGITTLLERRACLADYWSQKDAVDAFLSAGPRLLGSGPGLSGALTEGPSMLTIRTLDDLDAAVTRLAEGNVDWIDLADPLPRALQKEGVARAAEKGLPAAATARSLRSLVTAVSDGAFALSGIPPAGFGDDVARLLAGTSVLWSPCLAAEAEGARLGLEHSRVQDPLVTEGIANALLAAHRAALEGQAASNLGPRARRLRESVAAAHAAGARIACGTASPGPTSLYGASLQGEIGSLVAAGLSPVQALRAATIEPARALGLGDLLGSIEAGRLADFVLLRQDPTENIRAIEDIAWVVREGRAYRPAELLEVKTPQVDDSKGTAPGTQINVKVRKGK